MGIETELFEWKDWDKMDEGAFAFYNCELQKDIGQFKRGDKIPTIDLDIQEGIIEFIDKDGKTTAKFELNYSIGKEIPLSSPILKDGVSRGAE